MHMRRHLYEIVVEGDLRAADREWLADLAIHRSAGRRTALFGYLDQSALLGVLKRLQYLALEVCGVRRMCGCAADPASWPSREMASAASPAGASRGVADQMSGVNP